MNLLKPAFIAAALLASACATTSSASGAYTHIADPEQLFSAADWTTDVDAAVKAAGWSARADEIKAHMNEKTGWPAKLMDEDSRWFQKDMLTRYNVQEIARLTFYDQPAILLHVPAAANQHMPEGWKPAADFFIVVSDKAMSAPK